MIMTNQSFQGKPQISKKEAKHYFTKWIEELRSKIDAQDPESEKLAEQVAFLELARGNMEDDETDAGFFN